MSRLTPAALAIAATSRGDIGASAQEFSEFLSSCRQLCLRAFATLSVLGQRDGNHIARGNPALLPCRLV